MAPNKKPRMIDLTKDSVSPKIRRYIKLIESEYTTNLKNSNIPMMSEVLAKTGDNLTFYFLNRKDYVALMGENAGLVDRAFTSALATVMANDIHSAMNTPGNKKIYPGIWNFTDIYSIVAASITLMQSDDGTKLYLTGHQYSKISDEDLAKLNPNTYMEYTEYNPNRLFQMYWLIYNIASDVISNIIKAKIPMAMLTTDDKTLNERYAIECGTVLMHNILVDKINIDPATPATERIIYSFADAFEKPFMMFMTLLMQQSGLTDDSINMMLSNTNVNVIYDISDKGYAYTKMTYKLSSKTLAFEDGTKPEIEYSFEIGNIITLCKYVSDKEFAKTVSKGLIDRVGKMINSLNINLCKYTTNLYNCAVRPDIIDELVGEIAGE